MTSYWINPAQPNPAAAYKEGGDFLAGTSVGREITCRYLGSQQEANTRPTSASNMSSSTNLGNLARPCTIREIDSLG